MGEVGGRIRRREVRSVGSARAWANAATDVLKESSRWLCAVNYDVSLGAEL